MPLHIDRVQSELDIMPDPTAPHPTTQMPGGIDGRSQSSDAMLKERLRPIVMEILQEELEMIRRQQGRA